MPELVFLASGGGESAALAAALADRVGAQDAAAALCEGELPVPRPDRVYALVRGGEEAGRGADPPDPLRTILVLLSPPGGAAFERDAELARLAGGVFHVNAAAVEPLVAAGIAARHLQLGYTALWDRAAAAGGEPEAVCLAAAGGYFDWPRTLRAICAGAVVVHERALGMAPLVADRHLVEAAPGQLEAARAELLAEPERAGAIRDAALEFVRAALPMELAAAALLGVARGLVAQPSPSTPGQQAVRSK